MASRHTNVYLEPGQRRALKRRAEARGADLADEVRRAVDAYLVGLTAEGIDLIEGASRLVKRDLDEMIAELDSLNRRIDAALGRMDQIRARSPIPARSGASSRAK